MDVRSTGGAFGSWILGAVVLGMVVFGRAAAAQPEARAMARVTADTVRIGERFRLTLSAERAADARVLFPSADAGPNAFGAVEVLGERSRGTRSLSDGRAVDSVSYEVTTFTLDRVRLPSLSVRIVEGGDTTTVATSPQLVRVASVVGADASGLRTGNPLASFPQSLWPWVVWGAVGVALAGGGAYWWWRRRAESSGPEQKTSEATPYDTAQTRLRTLAASADLGDRDAVKPFYIELSDILRTYLADELGVAARERTTREVVADLQRRDALPSDATTRVEVVLKRADLVKFAGVRPGPDASKETYRHARDAIKALRDATQSLPIDGVASAQSKGR